MPIIAKRGEGVFTPDQMAAMGGGGNVNVNVNVENHNSSDVSVTKKQNSSGGVDLVVAVRDMVNANIANGGHDKAMASRFGARPQARIR